MLKTNENKFSMVVQLSLVNNAAENRSLLITFLHLESADLSPEDIHF